MSIAFAPFVEGIVNVTMDGAGAADLAGNPTVSYALPFVYDDTRPLVPLSTRTPYYANSTSLARFTASSNEP